MQIEGEAFRTGSGEKGNYWRMQYSLRGETVYACCSKCLPEGIVPGALEALDWKRRVKRDGEEVVATNMDHLLDALDVLGY